MPQNPRLYVEGKNDVHVVGNLLKRHNLELDPKGTDPSRPIIHASETDAGKEGGVEHLVTTIPSAIKVAERPVGFVIDADPHVGVTARWTAVKTRLESVGVIAPATIPIAGFIGESSEYKVRVGVWVMPDNQRDGTLETFLADLIDQKDLLIGHAIDSTVEAARIERRFKEPAAPKAELYAWLAWQEDPGYPYGVAIAKRYFRVDSPAALAFVDWFRRLYEL